MFHWSQYIPNITSTCNLLRNSWGISHSFFIISLWNSISVLHSKHIPFWACCASRTQQVYVVSGYHVGQHSRVSLPVQSVVTRASRAIVRSEPIRKLLRVPGWGTRNTPGIQQEYGARNSSLLPTQVDGSRFVEVFSFLFPLLFFSFFVIHITNFRGQPFMGADKGQSPGLEIMIYWPWNPVRHGPVLFTRTV